MPVPDKGGLLNILDRVFAACASTSNHYISTGYRYISRNFLALHGSYGFNPFQNRRVAVA